MPLNLVQHRGQGSVWDPSRRRWDPERWIGAAVAGVCLVGGFRRRTAGGWLLVAGGASLAWWAALGADDRQNRREQLRLVWPLRRSQVDPLDEALEETFPASDSPSFSGTIGNGCAENGNGRLRADADAGSGTHRH